MALFLLVFSAPRDVAPSLHPLSVLCLVCVTLRLTLIHIHKLITISGQNVLHPRITVSSFACHWIILSWNHFQINSKAWFSSSYNILIHKVSSRHLNAKTRSFSFNSFPNTSFMFLRGVLETGLSFFFLNTGINACTFIPNWTSTTLSIHRNNNPTFSILYMVTCF